ncbi:alpha/beta hydrolase family protein [Luteimonas terrae]|uniref:Dipeptidyl aminopeptidase/acylaminoacyl peptidase n=1 Tax=Luteimonas terrae TaxID=1530191 RepID=A0ABU1XTL5_9GAMM|nr:S9 family peptidase [Luteimonas terrae]MDR7191426.1 dipeptidyl aminopeptidase/acylaminoacyl peptidase [Luteimonas terrae]
MVRKELLGICVALMCVVGLDVRAQVDLAPFVAEDNIQDIKISPTGAYFAATLPNEGRTVIAVLDRSDRKIIGSFALPKNLHIADFWWAADDRLLFSLSEQFGARDFPQPTGELYAMNVDGSRAQLLVGQRVRSSSLGTNIRSGPKEERVFAWPIDMLRDDPRHILVGISPFNGDAFTRVDRLDIQSGRRSTVATVPVPRADFITDNNGEVRFARGSRGDNLSELYYRDGRGSDWRLINHESESKRVETPLGFSDDGATAYLQTTQPRGPDAIVAFDVASGEKRELLRDAVRDPEVVYRPGTSVPVGARFPGAQPRTVMFDENSEDARFQRMLTGAFPGQVVEVASATRDAASKLLLVTSDVDPGSFYTYDTSLKRAAFELGRRDQVDSQRMATMQAITLPARDGLQLHGWLTRPKEARAGQPLPLIVLPHGGPFGIVDEWEFDSDTQLLAQAGYAVLRLNYRGSGGYGRSFQQAGARQWGGTMQDDLTDATRWAMAQGHADPQRICIYGGSYGGYAALMGIAKEPDLYRCAVGYVGVYDLQMMRTDNGRIARWTRTWSDEWVGSDSQQLADASPTRLADRIKVPVLLVAGGEDEVAPIEHTRRMERALRGAGVPVETMYVANEGHGFYKPENKRAYYTKLLDFLATHLGGERAAQ